MDRAGNSSSVTVSDINIDITPPVAGIGPNREVNEGTPLTLDGSSSSDNLSGTDTYDWLIQDLSGIVSASGAQPVHVWEDNGPYQVFLTVTDRAGNASATRTATVTVLNVAPIATAGPDQTVDEGTVVKFAGSHTDPGTGDTHTYAWAFDDSATATGASVVHTYGDDGIYKVALTVTDDDLGTDTDTLTVTVNNAPPVITSLGSNAPKQEGKAVTFTALFDDPGADDAHSGTWDFGDGTTAQADISDGKATGSHTYKDNGQYTVTLTITDDEGASDTTSITAEILNAPPTATAGPDQTVDEGTVVNFAGSHTDPGAGDTHTYEWAFDDGATAAGASVVHTYGDDGIYKIALTVTDDDLGTDTDTLTVTFNNAPPVITTISSDESKVEGATVNFSATFTDSGINDSHTGTWNFGDNTMAPAVIEAKTVSGSHVYSDNGTYEVTLTITDDDGASVSRSINVRIDNAVPTAAAGENQTVDEGAVVKFAGKYSDPGADDTHTYVWEFGDGSKSIDLNPEHVYADNGVYTAILTVTDDDGGVGADTHTVTVNNVAPVIKAAQSDSPKAEGSAVKFDAAFTDAGSGDDHTATWDFGDGTTATPTVENGVVSGTHDYADNGEYTVTLTVVDDDGARDEKTLLVSITNVKPTAEAGPDQTVDEGTVVKFAGSHTDPGAGDTHTYAWAFDDGATATGASVVHTYGDDGIYTIKLTVTDDDGGKGTDSLTVTVNNAPPVITSLGSNAPKQEGTAVSFTAFFDDPGADDAHSGTWDFGDGTTAQADISDGKATGSHTYKDNGQYNVTLTITDDDSASVSQSVKVEIVNAVPTALAGPDQTVDEGAVVVFSGDHTDPGDNDTHTYTWVFGDGSTSTGTAPEHAYADNDDYIVTLWVTDDDGGVGSDTLTVMVLNVPPAVTELSSDAPQPEGTAVNFTAEYGDSGSDDIHTATWDYGDGTVEPAAAENGAVSGHHVYADNGDYTVTLTVTDDDGGQAVKTLIVSITNADPTAEAGPDQTVVEGMAVNFTGSHTDPGSADTHTYEWDFGDGATGKGTQVQHAYGDDGVYKVVLTVTDDDGGTGTDTLTVTVDNAAPMIDAGGDQTIDENATLALTVEISDTGWLDTLVAVWDFGDGSPPVEISATETHEPPHAAGSAVGTHSYEWPGVYTITVTVTDDDGAATQDSLAVVVQDAAPPNAVVTSPSPNNVGLCRVLNGVVPLWGIVNDVHDSDSHPAVQTPDHIGWYQLRYAPGQAAMDGWQDLTDQIPTDSFTQEQPLAEWDTTSLAEGFYTIQLIASEKTDALTHPNVTMVTAAVYVGGPDHLFSFGDETISSGKPKRKGKSHGRRGDDDEDDDRRGRRGDDDDDDEDDDRRGRRGDDDDDDDRGGRRSKTVLQWPGYVSVAGPEDGGVIRIPVWKGGDHDDDEDDDDDDRGRRRRDRFETVELAAGQYLIGVTESRKHQIMFFVSDGTDVGTEPIHSLPFGDDDDDCDDDDDDGRGRLPDAYDLALNLVEDPEATGTYDLEIYLAMRNGNKVLRIDKVGVSKLGFELVRKHGRKGRSKSKKIKFRKPTGIDLDGAGHIYVTDTENDRVLVLYPDGELEMEIEAGFRRPAGIQVVEVLDDDGYIVDEVIYVADTRNHRVVKLSRDGEILSIIGESGSGSGQLDTPLDVHVNSRGYLFVTEAGNRRVQKFDRSGNTVMQFGDFDAPVGLVMDPTEEILYVSDTKENRVEAYGLPTP